LQSSSGGSSVRIRASEAPRATAATAAATAAAREELQALEAERMKLERAVQSLTRELHLRGRDVDRPLADSLMRLRTRELRVRARTLAVARGLQQLTTRERVRVMSREAPRGWLGVSFEGGVVEETPRGAVLVAPGYPRIFTVSPGSPAEEAGLERGDRIVSIGGVDVRTQPIVLDDVFRPSESVPIRITREG